MKPNIKAIKKWIKALRSGDYKQARGGFKGKKKNAFCCLGVAGELFPDHITCEEDCIDYFNWGAETNDNLIKLNDQSHKSFNYIADWVEKNLLEAK
jgi:hypothetical protein